MFHYGIFTVSVCGLRLSLVNLLSVHKMMQVQNIVYCSVFCYRLSETNK